MAHIHPNVRLVDGVESYLYCDRLSTVPPGGNVIRPHRKGLLLCPEHATLGFSSDRSDRPFLDHVRQDPPTTLQNGDQRIANSGRNERIWPMNLQSRRRTHFHQKGTANNEPASSVESKQKDKSTCSTSITTGRFASSRKFFNNISVSNMTKPTRKIRNVVAVRASPSLSQSRVKCSGI